MRTCLFSPLYLDGADPSGSSRMERNIRWVRWYHEIKDDLGFDDIWMCDNGSSFENIRKFKELFPAVKIHEFPHLPRGDGPNPYPYCWRALYFLRVLVDHEYDKIITLDSDTFVISKRLASYIKSISTGWETFYSRKYDFPMAEAHILCRDTFRKLFESTWLHWSNHLGSLMERSIPFTRITRDFDTDRYGETRDAQSSGMDLYSQAPVDLALQYGRFG